VCEAHINLTLNGLLILSGTNDSPRSIGSVEESAFESKNLGEVSKRLREKKPLASATISTIELTLRSQLSEKFKNATISGHFGFV